MCRPEDGRPISASPGAIRLPSITPIPRDRADDEAGDIVLAVRVEPGHLRGLAAEQRASVLAARRREPLHDLHGDVRVEPARRQVIEKEQRLRTLDEDVVDAVVDEVDADRAMDARQERDAQLRADAVGAGHQHRIRNAGGVEPEQAAERSDSESTPGVNVPRASDRMRRTTSLPASMSTPACL